MYPTKKLWEICDIKTWKKDANYSTEDWKYAFFTCWEKILKSPWYSFDTSAILIAWNWDVWACKKYEWKFEAYQRTYVLDNFISIEKDLLFYYLNWNLKRILLTEVLWSAIPYIKLWSLQKIEIPLPPLQIQKLIVQKLDSAFENINKNINLTKENLKNLEELNKSVLEEVFIKLEKEYWLSSISKSTLKAKSDIVDGPFWSNLKSWEYVSEWIPLIRLQNVDRFNFLRKDIKYVTIEKYNQLIRHSYKAWDIVITKLWSPLWKACIVPNDFAFWTIVADIIRVRVNNAENITKFIMFMINSINCWKQFIWNTQWSTRPRVKLSLVRELQIPLPPLQKQKEIVSYLDQVFEKNKELKTKYELQLKELEELKQSLLKDAFEGRLVKE